MAGTIAANVNFFFVLKLFPHGGQCNDNPSDDSVNNYCTRRMTESGWGGEKPANMESCKKTAAKAGVTDPIYAGMRTQCIEYKDAAYASYGYICIWADTLLIVMLTLSINCGEAVMKWTMSWHLLFMMGHMNQQQTVKSHAVILTSLVGCLLSFVITRLTRGSKETEVKERPKKIADALKTSFRNGIQFMITSPNMSTFNRNAHRFQLAQQFDSFASLIGSFQTDLDISKWENLNIGKHSDSNHRLDCFLYEFTDKTGGFDDVVHVLKEAIKHEKNEHYDDDTIRENKQQLEDHRDGVLKELWKVSETSTQLLSQLAEHAGGTEDGKKFKKFDLDPEDLEARKKECTDSVEKLLEAMTNSHENYQDTNESFSKAQQILHVNFRNFVYALTRAALVTVEIADGIGKKNDKKKAEETANSPHPNYDTIKNAVLQTWGMNAGGSELPNVFSFRPQSDSMKEKNQEKRMFALRNGAVISIAFLMGNLLSGSVFDPFSAYMAGTLGLLITHGSGSAIKANITRLLGVVLGKSVPIILMAVVSMTPFFFRSAAHVFAVFAYISYFQYVYYTSVEWGMVGCLMGGFGCYSLVGTSVKDMWSAAVLVARYKEVAQLATAVIVQTIIDTLDTVMRNKLPRDCLADGMSDLGMPLPGKTKKHEGLILQGLRQIMDCRTQKDMDTVTKIVKNAKAKLSEVQGMLGDADEKSIVARGIRDKFPLECCKRAMNCMQAIISEMEVMVLVGQESFTDQEAGATSDKKFQEIIECEQNVMFDLMLALKPTFVALQQILERTVNSLDTRIEPSILRPDARPCAPEATEDLKKQMPGSLRWGVVWRSLSTITTEATSLEHVLFESGAFRTHVKLSNELSDEENQNNETRTSNLLG